MTRTFYTQGNVHFKDRSLLTFLQRVLLDAPKSSNEIYNANSMIKSSDLREN
jgi:hypothetical protein